jgi:hypothetical protein
MLNAYYKTGDPDSYHFLTQLKDDPASQERRYAA